MDTCINYCEPGWAYVSSDERRWINKLCKLAEEHPQECVVLKNAEDNGGFIYAKVTQKWVKISPPRQVILTDEERQRRRDLLARAREGA